VIDRTKLPDDLWVRMTWAPKNASGIQERPITLVSDRRRWLIGLIPVAVAGLLLIALALLHAPLVLLIVPILVSLVGARYAAGGFAGYYEVREDGTLGDFLGRKAPVGISEMRRTKAGGGVSRGLAAVALLVLLAAAAVAGVVAADLPRRRLRRIRPSIAASGDRLH
jgi:hypothetical protein